MPSAQALSSLAVLAIVCTVAAFMIFFRLIAEIGGIRATLVTYINTAVAVVLGVVLLGEPVTLGLILGFPLVLGGSWLASKH
jgi:drug/metabolite transporter (DMT)-like permease